MSITVTFASLEEMRDFAAKVAGMAAGEEKQAAPVQPGQAAPKKAKAGETAPKPPAEEPDKKEPPAEDGTPEYRLEDVRAKLAELNKSGKRAEVKALLAGFGAEKLSGIPEGKYGELMERAGGL